MHLVEMPVCAICGEVNSGQPHWFLMAENRWEDKLKILEWDTVLALQDGMVAACSAAHVEELVLHWMATGSLDYPFARTGRGFPRAHARAWRSKQDVDTQGATQIGELAVDRASMERILSESPQSLQVILDALLGALHRERKRSEVQVDSDGQPACAFVHEI